MQATYIPLTWVRAPLAVCHSPQPDPTLVAHDAHHRWCTQTDRRSLAAHSAVCTTPQLANAPMVRLIPTLPDPHTPTPATAHPDKVVGTPVSQFWNNWFTMSPAPQASLQNLQWTPQIKQWCRNWGRVKEK